MPNKYFSFFFISIVAGLAFLMPVFLAPVAFAQTVNSSRNWAGYEAQSGTYTSVSGSWTVPSVGSAGATSADAEWVGIGGVASSDLIQSGTQAIIDSSGQITYQAWLETLPQTSQPIAVTIKPGDNISVSITEATANQWQIIFKDLTSAQTFQTTVAYASSRSSAEWIVEAPAVRGGFLPLDNFGTISFTGGLTTANGQILPIAQSGATLINMLNNNQQALANISPLSADGQSFSVSRTAAVASPPAGRYIISRGRTWRRNGSGVSRRITLSWGFNPSGLSRNRMQFKFFTDR